jgi:hypothetical protein
MLPQHVRVALLVIGPVLCVGGFFAWRWNTNRPPSHALCVEQAERRLERGFGDGLAREANEHPQDYERLRTSMITTCELYWTKRYAECLRERGGLGGSEECEKLGRVRER